MRVFVCSPLRGPDGQPSERNITLARKLMRAVFDAGHQPFVPHLLYPQVLSESEADLRVAFIANDAWLDVSDVIWVYARDIAGCSAGMKREVIKSQELAARHWETGRPRLVWMPPPFAEVEAAMVKYDGETAVRIGECVQCHHMATLNRADRCLSCFAAGTPNGAPSA